MGAHVIPSFSMLRAFTLREPYDFVVVARRDTFAAVRDVLHRHYPNTLLVFDTVDLHFPNPNPNPNPHPNPNANANPNPSPRVP